MYWHSPKVHQDESVAMDTREMEVEEQQVRCLIPVFEHRLQFDITAALDDDRMIG